jgi:hypothetical protein
VELKDTVDVGDDVVVRVPGAVRVGLLLTVDVRLDEPETVPEVVPRVLTDGDDVVLGDFVFEIDTVAEEVPEAVRVEDIDPVDVVVPTAVFVIEILPVAVVESLGDFVLDGEFVSIDVRVDVRDELIVFVGSADIVVVRVDVVVCVELTEIFEVLVPLEVLDTFAVGVTVIVSFVVCVAVRELDIVAVSLLV